MGKCQVTKDELWRAINDNCFECCALVKEEIALCETTDCPLYPFRSGLRAFLRAKRG